MASKQGTFLTSVPSNGGAGGVGQTAEAVSPAEMAPRARVAAASSIGVECGAATWFRGVLLRRRCDACGTRINILGEGADKVFMRCPECLREYVFVHRPE